METKPRRRMLAKLWGTDPRQTELSFDELSEFTRLSPEDTDALLNELSREGYIHMGQAPGGSSERREIEIMSKALEELGDTGEELEELHFDANLERQRMLLRELRRRRLQDIDDGRWQTAAHISELSNLVGLGSGKTAELLYILLREGYMEGTLDFAGRPIVRMTSLTRKGLEEVDEVSASRPRTIIRHRRRSRTPRSRARLS